MTSTLQIRSALAALALGSVLITPLAADALTATGALTVTATVAPSCSVSATAIDFGAWSFVAASTSSSTITVDCTVGTAVASVGLSNGLQPVATVRQLKAAGAATIAYGLYQDALYATPWTDAAWPALGTYAAVAAPAVFVAYGRAPAGPKVVVGTYTDTVTVTVTYS